MFTNPIKRTSFEFDEEDGVVSADIIRIDSRFVSLFKWLGENHIKVQLSGADTDDGYAFTVCVKWRLARERSFRPKMDFYSI